MMIGLSRNAAFAASGATAFAMAFALAACGKGEPAPPRPLEDAPRAVRTALVERGVFAASVSAAGRIVARDEAAVSAEVGGLRVLRVLVEEGARVRRGQLLAETDTTLLRAQAASQTAALGQAEAVSAKARADVGRVAGITPGVVSAEEIDRRRFDARGAEAAVRAARAQLAETRARIDRASLRAPVDGVVTARSVRVGELAGGGPEPAFRIASGNRFELEAELPEAQAASVLSGDAATVELSDGSTVPGRVRLVSPRVDDASRLARVRIAFGSTPVARAGGFASARIASSSRTAVLVPERAVSFEGARASLMVVGRDGRVGRVAVVPGARSDGRVELRRGPPPGTRIVLGAGSLVVEGDRVDPRDEDGRSLGSRAPR